MADITIEQTFKDDVKRHLRITHTADDALIDTDIQTAAANIFEIMLLIPQTLEDGSTNPNYPTSSSQFTQRQTNAIRHLVATYRQNPDERIESRFIPQTKRLIERILGPELKFPKV